MKKFISFFLVLTLLLTGCGNVALGNGTLSIDSGDVQNIEITNLNVNHSFTIADREQIHSIVRYLNSYDLGTSSQGDSQQKYSITLVFADDSSPLLFEINTTTVSNGTESFEVDALKLVRYIEARECDTLTDKQLIELFFLDDYLDRLNILNDKGEISLDKIAKLGENCPALFELLSRPTLLKTIGKEGLRLLENYIDSDNIQIRERAEKLAALVKTLAPEMKEKIENILETIENSQK